ncbi:hypothetical protein [Hyalangium rubrum]|uniref:Lipoprotein n=1 Tax=Hyalangium rubrum TaxID=3103134 RepID=A0ABU5HED2_9BACT|nr:hypothetical protein [Hyalangium sp. s54d21]MDY7231846.1 hypothetical protein [Hyalangium sp. s54d21]
MKRVAFGLAVSVAVLMSCAEPEEVEPPTPTPAKAEVTFVYKAATERNFDIADCGVGPTHIHPSWRDYELVNFVAFGPMEWRRTFSDVPVGERLRIRVSDANYCDRDPNGASTENVFANGVQLTNVVDTPGTGIEPGLSFLVGADGTVTP